MRQDRTPHAARKRHETEGEAPAGGVLAVADDGAQCRPAPTLQDCVARGPRCMLRTSREAWNMRASQWLVGFSGLATIVGTIATGCGDDTAAPPGNDASADTAASSGGSSGG